MTMKSLIRADGVAGVSAINRVGSTGQMAGFRGKLEGAVWDMWTLGHSGNSRYVIRSPENKSRQSVEIDHHQDIDGRSHPWK